MLALFCVLAPTEHGETWFLLSGLIRYWQENRTLTTRQRFCWFIILVYSFVMKLVQPKHSTFWYVLFLSVKNFFRVSFKNGSQSQSHSLQANDSFSKQQWLNCIRQAKEKVTCAGKAGVLSSEACFILSPNGSRVSEGETMIEQMDQSDSESDCSMDTSEISIDCERMEQTNPCESEKQVETNVWHKPIHGTKPVSYLYSICIPHMEPFGEALLEYFLWQCQCSPSCIVLVYV